MIEAPSAGDEAFVVSSLSRGQQHFISKSTQVLGKTLLQDKKYLAPP